MNLATRLRLGKIQKRLKQLSGSIENQSGVALVMVMLVLVILSFMGLSALLTSSDEIFLSGNFKGGRETFFAAEGGIQYVYEDSQYFDQTKYAAGSGTSYAGGFPSGGPSLCNNETDALGSITYMASGPLPAGRGSSAKHFKADYYMISSTGRGFIKGSNCGATNGAQAQQTQIMAKILAKGTGGS